MQIREWMKRARVGRAHGWCCQGGWSQRGLSAFIRCRSIDKQRMQQCTPVTFMVPRTPSLSSIPPSTRFLSHPRTRQTNWKRKCAPPAGWPLRRPCGQHEEAFPKKNLCLLFWASQSANWTRRKYVKNEDAGGKDSRPMDDDDDSNETRRFPTAFFPRKQRHTHSRARKGPLFQEQISTWKCVRQFWKSRPTITPSTSYTETLMYYFLFLNIWTYYCKFKWEHFLFKVFKILINIVKTLNTYFL